MRPFCVIWRLILSEGPIPLNSVYSLQPCRWWGSGALEPDGLAMSVWHYRVHPVKAHKAWNFNEETRQERRVFAFR